MFTTTFKRCKKCEESKNIDYFNVDKKSDNFFSDICKQCMLDEIFENIDSRKILNIGFIGTGFLGGAYAQNFKKRGFNIVQYSLEEQYIKNKDKIKNCDIVFIAVPTPTTPDGFSYSIVDDSLKLVRKDKIAIIKSTILPGTTIKLQAKYPDIVIFYSPEFLSESTSIYDADNPFSNIVGMAVRDGGHIEGAELIHKILPEAKFKLTCGSTEAEIIKYYHNVSGYVEIVLANIVYNLTKKLGADWEVIYKAIEADPSISNRYSQPVHKDGRGAGGHCLTSETKIITNNGIKDISKIKVGDLVFTHLGNFKKIINIFKRRYVGELYSINCQGLNKFNITDEHPILSVKNNRKYYGIKRKKLSNTKNIKLVNEWNKPFNLSIGDYISFPYLNVKNNDSIIIKNDNFLSKLKDVKKFMRLLGYYVAEGFCDNKRIGFAFNKNEIEYHEDVSKLMKELFGLDVHYTKRENNNCYILRFYSVELCKIFSRFNKKEKMAIKNTWLNLSNDYLKQFFIGYFRGDGSDSMNIYTCATISENLFNQLRYVLNRFNIIYNISIHNARIDKKGVKFSR